MIERNTGKLLVYEMPTDFDTTLVQRPSRHHGTLQNFFKSYLLLERDPDSLDKIEILLHRPAKGRKDFTVNYLNKKNMGKEMCMNIHIGDYEVDSIILDLGLDVNILTRQTWKMIEVPMLSWSRV